MIIGIQDELLRINSLGLLDRLLEDRTTKAHILWATDAYTDLGPDYQRDREIRAELITGECSGVIKNRARKALEQQSARTRQHAEVFTPNWVCAKMCGYADEVWFGRPDGFFRDGEPTDRVEFPKRKSWKRYVDDRRMEITCGEAPFLVSRYDVSNGEIIPLERRTGLLDRKLRVVAENTGTEEEWLQWALRAFQATYGYEFQGDNLLIARLNLLMTFEEYLSSRWKRKPTKQEYETITDVIVWNVFQMDGLTYAIPYRKPEEEGFQFNFFEDMGFPAEEEKKQPYCRIYDWRKKTSFEFQELRKGNGKMKFNFIIGNPPYQEEVANQGDRANPIYDKFMEGSYTISNAVELIHPARFLFDAGQTPKAWNKKMLNDEHLKVLFYEPDASCVFPNTNIVGGIAITYHDITKKFGIIGFFTPYAELNSIMSKVVSMSDVFIESIVSARGNYRLTPRFFADFNNASSHLGTGSGNMIVSNIFDAIPEAFTEEPIPGKSCVRVLGRVGSSRTYRYIEKKYFIQNEYLDTYNVLVSEADGAAGRIGIPIPARIIGKPIIAKAGECGTDTFISIGQFSNEIEATMLAIYLQTKFARAMLGIKKATQHNPRSVWQYVPLQDFTPASDIDWSKSIPEIDRQLYAKYGLDEAEIAFIESHVKEMS